MKTLPMRGCKFFMKLKKPMGSEWSDLKAARSGLDGGSTANHELSPPMSGLFVGH
jgi:hypothetical protein